MTPNSIVSLILFQIFAALFMVIESIYDSQLIASHNFIGAKEHRVRVVIRIFIYLFVASIFIDQSESVTNTIIQLLIYLLHAGALFWLFFDGLLNILTDKPILYLGTVSALDKFFSNKVLLYLLIKVSTFTVSLILLFEITKIANAICQYLN